LTKEKNMGLSAGLVGLPNVGKSTLFNALTRSSVPAENYPFCTIEPHAAVTALHDERAVRLQKIYNSKKIVSATFKFVDIAGLVKGAASGEGLGNQFLSHIREVDLILHVLRCFADPLITHSSEKLDPLADYEVIVTELMLKDLESVTKRKQKMDQLIRLAQQKPLELKELQLERDLLNQLEVLLNKQDSAGVQELISSAPVKTVDILAAKKFLIIANIGEDEVEGNGYEKNRHYQSLIERFGSNQVIPISAKLEYELTKLEPADAQEMAAMMGLVKPGLDTIIEKSYHAAGLITFFTCGPQEIHAWPLKKGTKIRRAAGEIHSDLERGFICSDIFNCQDIFIAQTEAKLKEQGKMRTEGQDYTVADGDVVHVKFNV
jgi:GTP-binding protein YchF